MASFLTKIFGSRNDRLIKQYRRKVAAINKLEPEMKALSDEQLKAKTAEFRQRLADGASLDSLLPEAFAVVREASFRVLGMRHFDVQLIGGMVLNDGKIAESYNLMRNLLGLDVKEMADIFSEWNKGELDSYLIDITADILTRKDDLGSDKPIVDMILDRAGNKGTGKWSSQSALELGVPQSVITESVYARYISAMKQERVEASKVLPKPVANVSVDKKEAIEMIRKALYFSKLMSYAQGFEQLRFASEKYDWKLQYGDLAKIWRAGCIIRARFLQNITDAYNKKPDLQNLLRDDYFLNIAKNYQESVRDLVGVAVKAGVPVPGLSAAISYYDSYRSAVLPANLTQAQRDYFGAHTYERTDRDGIYHYSWYTEA